MNGLVVGDATTGGLLLSLPLTPNFGLAGLGGGGAGSAKESASALAAFIFTFLHRASGGSTTPPSASHHSSGGPALPGLDGRLATTIQQLGYGYLSIALPAPVAATGSDAPAQGPLSDLLGGFPPNAAPVPFFAHTPADAADGGTAHVSIYAHPALPLFCVAVDRVPPQSPSPLLGGEGAASVSSCFIADYAAAAVACAFADAYGAAFAKAAAARQQMKSADLKAAKKVLMPFIKRLYRSAGGCALERVLSAALDSSFPAADREWIALQQGGSVVVAFTRANSDSSPSDADAPLPAPSSAAQGQPVAAPVAGHGRGTASVIVVDPKFVAFNTPAGAIPPSSRQRCFVGLPLSAKPNGVVGGLTTSDRFLALEVKRAHEILFAAQQAQRLQQSPSAPVSRPLDVFSAQVEMGDPPQERSSAQPLAPGTRKHLPRAPLCAVHTTHSFCTWRNMVVMVRLHANVFPRPGREPAADGQAGLVAEGVAEVKRRHTAFRAACEYWAAFYYLVATMLAENDLSL